MVDPNSSSIASPPRLIKPAGALEPHEVFGRDGLIEEFWNLLRTSSVIVDAPRRMGKSSILRKMAAEAPVNAIAIWIDLEVPQNPTQFYQTVYDHSKNHLLLWRQLASSAKHLTHHLGGIKAFGIALPTFTPFHWTNLITKHVAGLLKANPTKHLILMFDELPLMLGKFCKADNHTEAAAVLGTLRHLREVHGNRFRTVYSGSVGLHHVIDVLEARGIREPSLNTMELFNVPPLSADSASLLAAELAQTAKLTTEKNTHDSIAKNTDGIPFYIHHVLRSMTRQDVSTWSNERFSGAFDQWLADPADPWKIRSDHFQRLTSPDYYDEETRRVALAILDLIASKEAGAKEVECHACAASARPQDVNQIVEWCDGVLRLLCLDHYLVRNGRTYAFRYKYFMRWWQVNRPNYGGNHES